MKAYITGTAYYLPELIEENTNARLRKKTGILRRHICPPEITAGDMAVKAAQNLSAGITYWGGGACRFSDTLHAVAGLFSPYNCVYRSR